MKRWHLIIAAVFGAIILIVLTQTAVSVQSKPLNFSTEENSNGGYADCRAGVGVVHNPITIYDISQFNLGWYVDWNAPKAPVIPEGMDFYFTIGVKQDVLDGQYLPTYTVTPALDYSSSGLGTRVQANPGSVWLIGNEPDIESQNGTLPEKYAEIYHEVYTFIKSIDGTAQIAIGAIVQPTPLRLEYLDRVLVAYKDRYGAKLPVDIWNTHLYIVREVRGDWGVKIPPGFDDIDFGRQYSLSQHVQVEELIQLVVELRTWMKARGYQDKPLIITEYGALMPLWFLDDDGVTREDIHEYLRDAIDYLFNATDTNLGYPGDNYRLVQRAALWSLDADNTFPDGYPKWDSNLFSSTSPYAPTETGIYYRDVIVPQQQAYVDLYPYRVSLEPSLLKVSAGETISTTVHVLVSNAGSTAFTQPLTVRFSHIMGSEDILIGEVVLEPFTGCGTHREAKILLPNLSQGVHQVRVEVDPYQVIDELTETNNQKIITVVVGTHAVYFPLAMLNW